jgi:hypothetical protein
MSDIFYSQVDANLQRELELRAAAGKTDRSDRALRYMTEKIANVRIVAYEGNRRDDTKEVHELGGKTVSSGEYLPGGEYGYLSNRQYSLSDTRWVGVVDSSATTATALEITNTKNAINNESYRVPPFITSAEISINDNSQGLTNRATLNITIPNPTRDLDFIESIYARPGRYCMVVFEYPETALMTQNEPDINGMLTTSSLPDPAILEKNYPAAAADSDSLRKMNRTTFEGLITSFEYQYTTDGTVTLTVYILGTSMVYTDLSMIMQTSDTTTTNKTSDEFVITEAKTFYQAIQDEVWSLYENKRNPNVIIQEAFGISPLTEEAAWILNYTGLDGHRFGHINLNYLIDFLNRKILSKVNDVIDFPEILCDSSLWCNNYDWLCSADPHNIYLHSNAPKNKIAQSDSYGFIIQNETQVRNTWYSFKNPIPEFANIDDTAVGSDTGIPSNIYINLSLIEEIINDISNKKDEFTVKTFLSIISTKISAATGGVINLKLVADPVIPSLMRYIDTTRIDKRKNPKPFLVPMFANDSRGTVVRDFKLSAKLPSNVQSLMYSINNSDKVTEDQLAPYVNFMYNNAEIKRSGTGSETIDSSTFGNEELTKKLTQKYLDSYNKYQKQLTDARQAYGDNPTSEEKRNALRAALAKAAQYPRPTIGQSNESQMPIFPIEAEFTVDGIHGFRYGNILDFPGLPAKYRRTTTFTIVGLVHSISETGEWQTRITCKMRPKFD